MKTVVRHRLACGLVGVATLLTGHHAKAADGREVFTTFCAPCHGADGKARTPAGKKLGAKDLSESKLADADIEKQIVTGTKDAKGVDRMPSFKDRLKPDEIAALIAYVKTFRH